MPLMKSVTDASTGATTLVPMTPAEETAYLASLPPPPPVPKQDNGRFAREAHTSGATTAELFRATLPTNAQFSVSLTASGIALDNGASRTVWVFAVGQRLSNGAAILGQTVIGNIASGAGSPVAATAFVLAPVGNDVVISVTGLAAVSMISPA